MVTLSEIQEHTQKTYTEPTNPEHLINCILGELGEAANFNKKIIRVEHDPRFSKPDGATYQLKIKFLFEIIDLLYYSLEAARETNIPISMDLLWDIKMELNAVKYGRQKELKQSTIEFLEFHQLTDILERYYDHKL